MYQPYIRGKQFELIGIRELIDPVLTAKSSKISPIIEPVKDSSTLKSTLKELVKHNLNFTVIVNPQVGTFTDSRKILGIIKEVVGTYKNFQVGIIFHKGLNHSSMISMLNEFEVKSISVIHNCIYDDISTVIEEYTRYFSIKFNVVNLRLTNRRYNRNFEKASLVELDDHFSSQPRNSDYLKVGESYFSEEHLYYEVDGFGGFADYLAIGEEYSETGFLPYAVAIHLSYDDAAGKIKIRHFVSDSNDDQSDIGGKFEEALNKLIEWCDVTGYNSVAIPLFRELHKNGHFPGLGTIKKLSLMNHIDLVLKLI